MQLYSCHKFVRAAKITKIEWSPVGNCIMELDGETGPRILFKEDLANRPVPAEGMYFIQYLDNAYFSFSPAAVFEAGYTPAEEPSTQQSV